mmetsp:Transcript_99866/g.198126  ORF Transcript_99866/g.198126 Transcript_99866/m.198126 type:complete len:207 (+) Transcript_99866:648-1268(+)
MLASVHGAVIISTAAVPHRRLLFIFQSPCQCPILFLCPTLFLYLRLRTCRHSHRQHLHLQHLHLQHLHLLHLDLQRLHQQHLHLRCLKVQQLNQQHLHRQRLNLQSVNLQCLNLQQCIFHHSCVMLALQTLLQAGRRPRRHGAASTNTGAVRLSRLRQRPGARHWTAASVSTTGGLRGQRTKRSSAASTRARAVPEVHFYFANCST